MRALVIVAMVCCLAGCERPRRPARPKPVKETVDESKVAEARKQFAAFVDEVAKGLELIESHPERDAINAEVKKLQEALQRASNACPADPKMAALAEEGKMTMRYFDACSSVANYQMEKLAKNQITADRAKLFTDKTCDGNAPAIREMLSRMKGKLGP